MIEITIPRFRFTDCVEEMCENYCKWTTQVDYDQLKRFCEECPLNNLDYDEFWERREQE